METLFTGGVRLNGIIDIWGTSHTLGGVVLGGWIDNLWAERIKEASAHLQIDNGETRGNCVVCLHPRDDIQLRGMGFIALSQMLDASKSGSYILSAAGGAENLELRPSDSIIFYEEKQLFEYARHFLKHAMPDSARTRFFRLLDRSAFAGSDTLESLPWPVHLHIDRTYLCPPDGLVIVGWFFDPFRQVARLRVCGGGIAHTIEPSRWVKIKRRDVVEGYAGRHDMPDDMLGFMVYVPGIFRPGRPSYFEVETVDGRVVHRPFNASIRTGLATIKEILSDFELRREALACGYDNVVGPAIAPINVFRLSGPPEIARIDFGKPPVAPRCSIIVPLYGRIDFLEYQLACFHDTLAPDHEIIYVLDDPPRRSELMDLADSCLARFERPFTIITLSHNIGYAPANNIGLAQAKGDFVCFLNSDVFPDNADWLECMIETAAEPRVGIVGAYLSYEDGTLQHDGCELEQLPDLAGWPFPMHIRKGLNQARPTAAYDREIVTGACMVVSTALARDLAGFDEGYIIGDFEDADLCKRVAQMGLKVMVEPRATLFHLERQSQSIQASRWRFNLTLYNAWRFKTKWYP